MNKKSQKLSPFERKMVESLSSVSIPFKIVACDRHT